MKDAKGHGSNPGAHSAGIEKAVKPQMSATAFARLVADAKAQSKQTDDLTAQVIAARSAVFEHASGKKLFVSPSLEHDGLRATSFDEKGEPLGHREYPGYDKLGLRSEISMALSGGYKLKARK